MELELCSQKLKVSLGVLHGPVPMNLAPDHKAAGLDGGGSPAESYGEACWQHKR